MSKSFKSKYLFYVDDLHTVFKTQYDKMSKENWQNRIKSYLKKVINFSSNSQDQRMVAGWLAALCERAYYIVAHGKSINIRLEFEQQLKDILHSTSLPKFLTSPNQIICGKRQPSFIACISPTFDRFQVMENLPKIFGNCMDSIIIGGSMSYVPFLGIRENKKEKDYSDIDALIIINDAFFKKSSWKKFLKNDLFLINEKEEFLNRINIFQKLLQANTADIFSQRFSVNNKSFTVSPHFLTLSVFRKMVYTDLNKFLLAKKDIHYILRDFRANRFTHPCHARHTFNGERIESVIDGKNLDTGGYISNMPGFTISNGKLYPGVYHTVISPSFLVFYDRTKKVSKLVGKFKNILYKEVKKNQKESSIATYSKAHNRYEIFAPGRFEEGVNSFISPQDIKKYLPPSSFNITKLELINSPKETNSRIFKTRNNNHIRNEARKKLEKWKKESLKKLEKEMEIFMSKGNLKNAVSLAKKQNRDFCTVVSIKARKELIIKIPQVLKQPNSENSCISKELCIQTVTPGELMRLNGYKKLSLIFGKAYISTSVSKAGANKTLPESYAIVVPVK